MKKKTSVEKSHTDPEVLVRLLFLRLFSVASSLLPALFESAEEPVCFTIADLSNFRLSGITVGTTGLPAAPAPVAELLICSVDTSIFWLSAKKLSIEPLVAVTTFAKKAFCLAANSGSRDRDDLLEAEAVEAVFGLVVLWLLLKKKERFIYTLVYSTVLTTLRFRTKQQQL